MNKNSGIMSGLKKKFSEINLSGMVVNPQKAPRKELNQVANEAEFRREICSWSIEAIKNTGVSRKSEPTNPSDIERMLKEVSKAVPHKVLETLLVSMVAPPYPSIFLFAIIYFLINDYDSEISGQYKDMIIKELKCFQLPMGCPEPEKNANASDSIAVASINTYRVREISGFVSLLISEISQGIYYGEKMTMAADLLMAVQVLPGLSEVSTTPSSTLEGMFGNIIEKAMRLDPDRWGTYMQGVMTKTLSEFTSMVGMPSMPPSYCDSRRCY